MIYSVWRPALRRYDYYEDGQQTAAFPAAPRINGRIAADVAGWRLPAGARKVGSGAAARGQIAQGLGGIDLDDSPLVYIGLALLGYGLWRIMRG